MKNRTINRYLIGAILTLTVVPLLASYWLLDEVLNSATGLIAKPETQQLLESYRDDLKTLKELDPERDQQYKSRFLQASDELLIYQQPNLLRKVLRDTYLTYYLLLFIAVLVFSLVAAIGLNRKVARSYRSLLADDIKKAKKIHELTNFEEWQTIASKLAHEINNPLTPIDMMVSNLSRVYGASTPEAFKENLYDTQSMVSEEVQKLKEMVKHFSRFSRLPEPKPEIYNLSDYCSGFIRQYQQTWPNARLKLVVDRQAEGVQVEIDRLLFNQCLINLVNNALQANQLLTTVDVCLTVAVENSNDVSLVLFNSGRTIDAADCNVIFQMYYSSKKAQENMGLGLSIVKKIVLDHRGDIVCLPLSQGAAFKITLPAYTNDKEHQT